MKDTKLEITYIPFELDLTNTPTICHFHHLSSSMDVSRYTYVDPKYVSSKYILKINTISDNEEY